MEKVFAELADLLRADPRQAMQLMLMAEAEFERAGYREEIPVGVEDILVVRLDAIGDMILTSGFLRELRANFPQARITLVCSPKAYPVVELCPYVNEVLTFDKDLFGRDLPTMFERIANFCRENLWQRRFAQAFSPQWGSDNLPALLMAWLSGARERIGYGVSPYASLGLEASPEAAVRDNFLLTKNIVAGREYVAEVEKYFYLLGAAGLDVNSDNTELFFGAEDFLRAEQLLYDIPPSCKKVILGIGASFGSRQYPVERLLVALQTLAEKDLVFIIVGGRAELDDANYLEQNLPYGKVLNLAGKTTLRETEAVIGHSDYYVGNDSGVMHMAATAQLPCLVFYREAQDKEDFLPGAFSEFKRFPPYQTKSVILRPDHQLEDCAKQPPIYGWCHHVEAHCIAQIPPQEVIAGFEALEGLEE